MREARFPPKRNERNARNAIDCVRKVRKKRNKRNKITQAKTLRKTGFYIQTQRTQAPANRNGRSKQPIIEAANQTLALLAVLFTQRTHRTQRN